MRRTLLLSLSVSMGLLLLALCVWLPSADAQQRATVTGRVMDSSGPIAGARVRVRATDTMTRTGPNGEFVLTSLQEGVQIEVAAWSNGYYIASAHVTPTFEGLDLLLRPVHTVDNPQYHWTSPVSGTSQKACGNCHPMVVERWQNNAHGSAVDNPRFFSLYNGSDIGGAMEQPPGYLLDFPGTSGNCANCHAPGAAIDGYLRTDMNSVRGVITAGIHCDYCHKIGGIYLAPNTASVYPNAPGVQSQRVLRPPAGDDIFFGPYDDIADPDTYLPPMSESQFCAPCHQFSFWGTPIYESYEEWLSSEYAEDGITCQDCHMPPSGDSFFALPQNGGLAHPPGKIPAHVQLGAADDDLLKATVSMTVQTAVIGNRLRATVVITNTGAGHHVPTDFPGRHMILLVTAQNTQGDGLVLLNGPTVPVWGGEFAGQPGKIFAKLLQDVASGRMPVVSYWKQALIAEDNRIPALASDRSVYAFELPDGVDGNAVQVSAQLIFRRVFSHVGEPKGWNVPDITMAEVFAGTPDRPVYQLWLPAARTCTNCASAYQP